MEEESSGALLLGEASVLCPRAEQGLFAACFTGAEANGPYSFPLVARAGENEALGPAYPLPPMHGPSRAAPRAPGAWRWLRLLGDRRRARPGWPSAGGSLGESATPGTRYRPSPRLPAALPALRRRARSPVTDLQKPPVPFALPRAHKWLSRDSAPCAGNAPGALYLHVGNKKRKAGQVPTTFDNGPKGRNRLGAGAGPAPFQAPPSDAGFLPESTVAQEGVWLSNLYRRRDLCLFVAAAALLFFNCRVILGAECSWGFIIYRCAAYRAILSSC